MVPFALPIFWFLGVCFFNDTATTEIYTLSLHDALPIFTDNREIMIFFMEQVPPSTVARNE